MQRTCLSDIPTGTWTCRFKKMMQFRCKRVPFPAVFREITPAAADMAPHRLADAVKCFAQSPEWNRGTSLVRKRLLLGPYSRPAARALW